MENYKFFVFMQRWKYFRLFPQGSIRTTFHFQLLLCFSLFTFCLSLCSGQSNLVSPYSSYGIGEFNTQPGVQGFSMGNTGIALRNDSTAPYFLNLKNPAACYYNRITTFEAAILNNNVTLSTQGQKTLNHNSYFGYFAAALPVGKWAGLSLGIIPMSNVGYDITASSNLDSIAPNGSATPIGTITNEYIGQGGINRIFLGLAISPGWKHLSMGFNASYIFGNITSAQTVTYPLNYSAFNTERVQNVQIKDVYFNYGLMLTLGKETGWHATLGGTLATSANINARYTMLSMNYLSTLNGNTIYDTIQDSNRNGKLNLPLMLGGGICIKKGEKWTFSFDYSMQNWNQYTYFGQKQNLSNSTQIGGGIQYIPKKNTDTRKTYFQRVHYRLGFAYNQSYLNINNTQLKEYTVSLGLGLPVGPTYVGTNHMVERASILNLGIQLGQLGTTSDNLLQEQYIKLLVGFTFNDHWFVRRQYE